MGVETGLLVLLLFSTWWSHFIITLNLLFVVLLTRTGKISCSLCVFKIKCLAFLPFVFLSSTTIRFPHTGYTVAGACVMCCPCVFCKMDYIHIWR